MGRVGDLVCFGSDEERLSERRRSFELKTSEGVGEVELDKCLGAFMFTIVLTFVLYLSARAAAFNRLPPSSSSAFSSLRPDRQPLFVLL